MADQKAQIELGPFELGYLEGMIANSITNLEHTPLTKSLHLDNARFDAINIQRRILAAVRNYKIV